MAQRRRLVSPTDRVTGGNRNPRGLSPRSVINERAPESLESLPVRCRFDFHDGSRRAMTRIRLKFRGKVYGAGRRSSRGAAAKEAASSPPDITANYIFARILITNKSDARVAVTSALSTRHVES